MARTVGVLKETFPGERCVAIVPRSVEALKKSDISVILEPSARRLMIVWRAAFACDKKALKVREVEATLAGAAA